MAHTKFDAMNFLEQIKKVMKDRNVESVQYLFEIGAISKSTFYNIANGAFPTVHRKAVIRFAKAFDLEVDEDGDRVYFYDKQSNTVSLESLLAGVPEGNRELLRRMFKAMKVQEDEDNGKKRQEDNGETDNARSRRFAGESR